MAITVVSSGENNRFAKETGIETGDEFIYQVPLNCSVSFQAILESAGSATIKYSLDEATPTDFTGFVSAASGANTATYGDLQDAPKGIRWIGLDVASGTWTSIVRLIPHGSVAK